MFRVKKMSRYNDSLVSAVTRADSRDPITNTKLAGISQTLGQLYLISDNNFS
jgi:hypothetical protein